MVICPACKTPNADDADACSRCSSSFDGETDDQTAILYPEAETIASPATSDSSPLFCDFTSPGEIQPGFVIGQRYEVVCRIGQGGMGSVYKVRDRELDRIIALKTIRPDLAANSGAIRRFKQEILLARQITHRNVIRIHDFGVADGLRFITMEWFDGEDLGMRLSRQRKLAPADAVPIFRQLCEGLAAAHAEDVVHRDLKPNNILINAQNQIRITDFGLARGLDAARATGTGVLLGTPDYMSPEQALGEQVDARSDLFAAGILLFYILTGELPFRGTTATSRLVLRTRSRAPLLTDIDPALPQRLSDIVARCLEPRAADRYQNAEQVRDDLDASRPGPAGAGNRSTSLTQGTLLGSRYRIESKAGQGGMGSVYRATDLVLNRPVALKLLRSEVARDEAALERMKQEILLASRVSHPRVLRIHDFCEADGVRFISMAWMPGATLRESISRAGALPEPRIRELAVQLCEGLAAAHAEGIVHRDLKPENVLFDEAGNVCIGDFGVATSLRTDQAATTAGTPRYMSPEQLDSQAVDERSDIYSLGLILYEMATAEVPLGDGSTATIMLRRATESPRDPQALNAALSPQFAAIILRCLERDPGRRFQTVNDLLTALRTPAAPPVTVPQPPAALRKLRPRLAAPRLRLWMWPAAAVLVALGAGTFFWLRYVPLHVPANGKYVAVLPFHVLASDAVLQFDSEGITEALSSRLFADRSLHPISPIALETVDLKQPTAAIARQVGANLVVAGSIYGQPDGQLLVSAHIENVPQHTTVWRTSLKGSQRQLLQMEDQLCDQVLRALGTGGAAATAPREPNLNQEAYDLYLEGRNLLKNRADDKRVTQALDLFQQACAKDPAFALAWAGVADASLQRYAATHESIWAEKALDAAERAKSRNDKLPEVHLSLGSVYTQTGKSAEAIAEILSALKLEPNSDDAYVRLGRAYRKIGKTEDAINALKKAVELNPYYWYNHDQLGKEYFRTGRNAEALKEFRRVVELDPNNAGAYNEIGSVYTRQNRWADSIPEFQHSLALKPTPDAYSNLGTAYFFLDRYSQAADIFEKAVSETPNDVWLQGNLADAYRQAKRGPAAAKAYDRAIQMAYERLQVNPRDAATLGLLATFNAKNGNLPKALDLIAQARSVDGSDSQLMYWEAVTFALAGRPGDAMHSLERALSNGYSVDEARHDPDLTSLQHDPAFRSLLKQYH